MDDILYHVNHHISLHGFLNRFTGYYRIFISIRRWTSNRYFDIITLCGRLRSWSAILIANLGDSTDWKEYSLYRHSCFILYFTSPNCFSQQLCRSRKSPLPSLGTRKLTLQCILRFLAGFIGSPPLATGGASLQDVFHPTKLPYAMGLYGLAAASGPALAPVISGYAVVANGWRWAFWIMLWLSGFSLALLAFTMPEVSSPPPAVRQDSFFDPRDILVGRR
jgi:MFS family permease